ncbi:hotdog fold thioesterase [Deinococcus radiotolerans]|uniref:Phenylacetic acid degradation protein PaaD n=1 Tax=Deinococcus radiotolerans TaxID=1309407 RepID=A0ABQ2FLN8_9DEIO|nr:hotdog fold thioesterase [Deinococcus radiotolerans]GGL00704.1 phenylacetic acid degradation protein PaaD [Deinococcus radiotolerans]
MTGDPYMAFLGVTVLEVGDGHATVSATVEAHHINMHGTAHGGFLFSLADAAFALASNSGPGRQVGLHADLQYLRAARLGDQVTASAAEQHLGRKTGAYRMEVRVNGQLIAMGSGLVYRV